VGQGIEKHAVRALAHLRRALAILAVLALLAALLILGRLLGLVLLLGLRVFLRLQQEEGRAAPAAQDEDRRDGDNDDQLERRLLLAPALFAFGAFRLVRRRFLDLGLGHARVPQNPISVSIAPFWLRTGF